MKCLNLSVIAALCLVSSSAADCSASVGDGKPVSDLQPYLGAMGLLVIMSEDGSEYVHSHPVSNAKTAPDGAVEFAAHFPKPGI